MIILSFTSLAFYIDIFYKSGKTPLFLGVNKILNKDFLLKLGTYEYMQYGGGIPVTLPARRPLEVTIMLVRPAEVICISFFCYLLFSKSSSFKNIIVNVFIMIIIFSVILFICKDFIIGVLFIILLLVTMIIQSDKKAKIAYLILDYIFLLLLIIDKNNIMPHIINYDYYVENDFTLNNQLMHIINTLCKVNYGEFETPISAIRLYPDIDTGEAYWFYAATNGPVRGPIMSITILHGLIPGIITFLIFMIFIGVLLRKIRLCLKNRDNGSKIFVVFSVHIIFFILVSLLYEIFMFDSVELPFLYGVPSVGMIFHGLELLYVIFYNPRSSTKSMT
jgi:hypothetical protein